MMDVYLLLIKKWFLDALYEKLYMVILFNRQMNWLLLFSHFKRKETNLNPKNSVT